MIEGVIEGVIEDVIEGESVVDLLLENYTNVPGIVN